MMLSLSFNDDLSFAVRQWIPFIYYGFKTL